MPLRSKPSRKPNDRIELRKRKAAKRRRPRRLSLFTADFMTLLLSPRDNMKSASGPLRCASRAVLGFQYPSLSKCGPIYRSHLSITIEKALLSRRICSRYALT